MKKTRPSNSDERDSGDFAVAGIFRGSVVLEANEWDLGMGVYRVVTLYLKPDTAHELAEQLANCAAIAAPDGATAN